MLLGLTEMEIMRVMEEAQDAGVKLEIHQGLPIWELMPGPRHTYATTRIDRSVRPAEGSPCGCFHFQDQAIQLPDGSHKRPDVSIFCELPPESDEATTQVPRAVVEVISRGSEVKDLELNPPLYMLHGVLDVIVLEPRTGIVSHFRKNERRQLTSPVDISLECGCVVTV